MKVTYDDVLKARAEAIRLGVLWNACKDDSRAKKQNEYGEAWGKYVKLDHELAAQEISAD